MRGKQMGKCGKDRIEEKGLSRGPGLSKGGRKKNIENWISVHLSAKERNDGTNYTYTNVYNRAEGSEAVAETVKGVRFRRKRRRMLMKRDTISVHFWAVTRAREVLTPVTAHEKEERRQARRETQPTPLCW